MLERRLTKQPGLSVAVAEGGRLVWEEGLGWAAVAPKLAASAGTRFRLYSVAKPITGALAVKLAREGRLSFDRAISAYLPGLPASLGALTLRRLLGHVSGIRDYRRGEWIPLARKHCDSALAAIEPFRNDPLEFKPGERFSYSSFNYVLGSAVIEAATGEPFHDLLQREIFAPAEMERTGPDTPKAEAEAGTRFFQARPFGRVRRAIPVDNSCKFGGGGLLGTSPDLARFGMALIEDRLLPASDVAELFRPGELPSGKSTDYALGLWIFESDHSRLAGASGGAIGGRSYLLIDPSRRIVIALASNLEGKKFSEEALQIWRYFAGVPESSPSRKR